MPCKHFADDGDSAVQAVPNKKPKKGIPTQSSTGSITSSRTSTTQTFAPDSPPCAQSCTQQPHAPKEASGNPGDASEPELIEVTDSNSDSSVELIEDDDDELGEPYIWLWNCKLIEL